MEKYAGCIPFQLSSRGRKGSGFLSKIWQIVTIAFIFVLCLIIGGVNKTEATQKSIENPTVVVGPNIRASANVITGSRNECWIAASLTSPDFLVGVAQTASSVESPGMTGRACAVMISRNGGQTWREVVLQNAGPGDFDPMVVAGPKGEMYVMYSYIGRGTSRDSETSIGSGQRQEGVIKVWVTTDEGRSWRGPTEIMCPLQPDHPRMAVDLSEGPNRGRIYIAWNEVSDTIVKERYHIFLNYSDDCAKTFSEPILLEVDHGGKLVTTEPIVLSDGTVLVTYYQYFWPLADPKNDEQPLYLIRSTDGAKTFDKPKLITRIGSSSFRHLRRDFGSAFTLPIITADTSPQSRFRDRIYIVWDDTKTGESNIWFMMSTDKGHTWSEPLRINDNKKAETGPVDFRMTPVVHVNKDGVIGIAWYDRREDPARQCWKYYFTTSLDGGLNFLPNLAVSSAPSCPDSQIPPTMNIWNISPEFEDTLPTNDDLKKMSRTEQRRYEEVLAIEKAWREANKSLDSARIMVNFNRGRSVWSGHYTGLTSDISGSFHAFWADRRAKLQQIYSARVEVMPNRPSPPPETREVLVTEFVQLIATAGKLEDSKNTSAFEVQLRNVSDKVIYGPLKVRITKLWPSMKENIEEEDRASSSVIVLNADSGGEGVGATWDFSEQLGGQGRLDPKCISEAKTILIRTSFEAGLDGTLEFEVIGRLPIKRKLP
ncbi:MAG: sialidase family protein [Acidobacteriota bacterium]|nr:sialidase family protein [Acidobacteriota bacterium]